MTTRAIKLAADIHNQLPPNTPQDRQVAAYLMLAARSMREIEGESAVGKFIFTLGTEYERKDEYLSEILEKVDASIHAVQSRK